MLADAKAARSTIDAGIAVSGRQLEAWAEGTPVIVHRDCARCWSDRSSGSQGGIAVADYAEFTAALDGLLSDEAAWAQRGLNGRAYVDGVYTSPMHYVKTITGAIERMEKPLRDQMRESGLRRAEAFARPGWQERFAEFVENLLTQPARPWRNSRWSRCAPNAEPAVVVRFYSRKCASSMRGRAPAVPEGPGRTAIFCEIRELETGNVVETRTETILPTLLMPGQTQVAALPITVPTQIGSYRIVIWADRLGGNALARQQPRHNCRCWSKAVTPAPRGRARRRFWIR